MSYLETNGVFIALVWMLLANLFAMGPDRLKVVALVVMLITAGPILVGVIAGSGWLIGLPLIALMLLQMRWALYFIRRVFGDA